MDWMFIVSLIMFCSVFIHGNTGIEELRKTVGELARQVMIQQQFLEERIRSDGDSGIKQVRINNEGTKTYHLPSLSSKKGIASLHDHSNHVRTIGLGEFIGVLNGVEFRTRHNDFLLRMPSTKSKNFLETEEIPYPDVPPEVTSKKSVSKQIKEMREWFKAWHEQNHKKRDYRKYFKPVLCYLEGTWIDKNYKKFLEPFLSDRHWLDAKDFQDLQNKIMFTSYNGRKSSLENFAWLPTTVMDVVNGTQPKYAQWIYRIACHPLKRDIPTSRFRLVDDISVRMMYLKSVHQQKLSRKARFQMNPRDSDKWRDQVVGSWELIDELMSEIPGLDNYGGNLTDDAFNNPAFELPIDGNKVNTAYYHRWWREVKPGAMGLSLRKRTFADRNIFMAMNTQPAVIGKSLENCYQTSVSDNEVCTSDFQRWSFAIPLEVIFMTPLSKWNPYDIKYHGDADKDPQAKYVTENDTRFGGISKHTAYNGTNSKFFYQTPASFFEGRVVDADKADTCRGSAGVLDKNGIVRAVTSSGIRALLPNIPGIGIIRQRYPIMPLHNEGSGIWKELDALKDIVMEHSKYLYMHRDQPKEVESTDQEEGIILELSPATKSYPGPHIHRIELTPEDVKVLKAGRPVVMITSEQSSHSHMVKIQYKSYKSNPWVLFRCDGEKECWDGHKRLYQVKA